MSQPNNNGDKSDPNHTRSNDLAPPFSNGTIPPSNIRNNGPPPPSQELPPPYTPGPQPLYPELLPPPAFNPYPPPKYDTTVPIYTQPRFYGATYQIATPREIFIIGRCPICGVGKVEEYYSCLGLTCAIFCFPLGLIPCLLLKDKICTNCGAQLN
uniref:Membrane protein BRI3 n=1 Tax=Cacopsylla melanoneura TaxID=428564 RepID=A0A8D9BM23_9HEMI